MNRSRLYGIAGVLLVLTLSGCANGGTQATTGPPHRTTPATTPVTTAVTTTPAPRPARGTEVRVAPSLALTIPKGWQVERFVSLPGNGGLCLRPPDKSVALFDCTGIAVYWGKRLPGAENRPYAANQNDGWYPATDVELCPFGSRKSSGLDAVRTFNGFASGLRAVGRHQAEWNRWSASCRGHGFHPEAWYLPTSKVVIFDYLGHPETASILASAQFARDGAALPPMPAYVTGHLSRATVSSVTLKLFTTYGNDAAGKAYATAHHLDYPFPDDYLDVETGVTRTFRITGATACLGSSILSHDAATSPVPCTAFADHLGSPVTIPVGVWVLPGSDAAESVSEVFRP